MIMMPKVKLKVSMIFGGAFYPFNTVLDREEVPLNLRKRKYLTDPNTEENVRIQEEIDPDEIFYDNIGEEMELEPEELPPTNIVTDSRAKYFKPKPKR